MTSGRDGRSGVRAGIAVLAVVLVAAACTDAGDADDAAEPSSATVATTLVTTTSTTALTTTVAPTTTEPLPVLAERFTSMEVSARIVSSGADRFVSMTITEAALAGVPDPGDPLEAAAWCSGVGGAATGPFVVRITGEVAGEIEGGIESFELVSNEPVVVGPSDGDTPSSPVPATLRLELDNGDIETPDAVLLLADEPTTGTFRAETPDGTVVEGAFRCS
ncbi:hypothetical protein BH23ACT3_BH23ACT3_12480 [soil metagenome]